MKLRSLLVKSSGQKQESKNKQLRNLPNLFCSVLFYGKEIKTKSKTLQKISNFLQPPSFHRGLCENTNTNSCVGSHSSAVQESCFHNSHWQITLCFDWNLSAWITTKKHLSLTQIYSISSLLQPLNQSKFVHNFAY